MKDTPSFVAVAALLGDQARATMLNSLMEGEARTASELAAEAGITKQTASSHLTKLVEAGLLCVQPQGRHRYFQFAAPDVASMIQSIMGVAYRTRNAQKLVGPRDPALRRARRCYDHLAGELAVEVYDSFVARGFLTPTRSGPTRSGDAKDELALTADGREFFSSLGIDFAPLDGARRPTCRPCLDWSVRRHHLAGGLGGALLDYCYGKRWAKPTKGSRVVRFSARGEAALRKTVLALR